MFIAEVKLRKKGSPWGPQARQFDELRQWWIRADIQGIVYIDLGPNPLSWCFNENGLSSPIFMVQLKKPLSQDYRERSAGIKGFGSDQRDIACFIAFSPRALFRIKRYTHDDADLLASPSRAVTRWWEELINEIGIIYTELLLGPWWHDTAMVPRDFRQFLKLNSNLPDCLEAELTDSVIWTCRRLMLSVFLVSPMWCVCGQIVQCPWHG